MAAALDAIAAIPAIGEMVGKGLFEASLLGQAMLVALVLVGNGLVVLRIETRELRRSFEHESLTFLRLAGARES